MADEDKDLTKDPEDGGSDDSPESTDSDADATDEIVDREAKTEEELAEEKRREDQSWKDKYFSVVEKLANSAAVQREEEVVEESARPKKRLADKFSEAEEPVKELVNLVETQQEEIELLKTERGVDAAVGVKAFILEAKNKNATEFSDPEFFADFMAALDERLEIASTNAKTVLRAIDKGVPLKPLVANALKKNIAGAIREAKQSYTSRTIKKVSDKRAQARKKGELPAAPSPSERPEKPMSYREAYQKASQFVMT